MKNLLFIIAIILLIIWILGVFVFLAGKSIHIVLMFAILAVVLRVFKEN